jgi:hypothetical protein
MKLTAILAAAYLATGAIVSAQTYTQTAETKFVTVDGEVLRYEPGRTIVVRGSDNREVTYTLTPAVNVPADIQVGRRVTLYTEPGMNGAPAMVSRVTTTSVTPEGNVKRTTEETRTQAGVTTKTTTTNVSGKVESYTSGKTLTITRADGTRVTYVIDPESKLPGDLVVGKTVTIQPLVQNGREVARVVTYVVRDPS